MTEPPATSPGKNQFSTLQQWLIGLLVPVVIAVLTILLLPFVE